MTAIVNHGIANARYAGVPVRLWSSGIPFLLSAGDGASNGLSFTGSAGGFTLSAAVIASTIAGLYVYLPANFGGSANAAGWYYATMSTTTAGILYNNVFDPSIGVPPTIPSSLTAFPNLSGFITSPVSEITAFQFTQPGGCLGLDGMAEARYRIWTNNSAGNKLFRVKWGSNVMHYMGPTTSAYNNDIIANIQNAGTLGRQINTRNGLSVGTGTTSVDGDIRAVDSSVNLTVSMTMQLPANTDSMICVFRQYTVNRA